VNWIGNVIAPVGFHQATRSCCRFRQSKKNAQHTTPRQWKSWKITQMNLMTLKLKAKIQSLFQDDYKESPAYQRIGGSTKE